MTDETRRNGREESTADDNRPTLGEISHTNPRTGESFGDAMVFHRGPTVAADGGEANAVDPDEEEADADAPTDGDGEPSDDQLKDVDHTPARGDVDVNRVHERGGEASDAPEDE
jgi:hypothetical protein